MFKTLATATLLTISATGFALAQGAPPGKPNILMIMADDIGWSNVSAYNLGIMGYRSAGLVIGMMVTGCRDLATAWPAANEEGPQRPKRPRPALHTRGCDRPC